MTVSSRFPLFNRRRARALAVFVVAFIATALGREIYRPAIYRNGIHDFGLADVIGNLLGSIAIIFLALGLTRGSYRAGLVIIAGVTLGLIGYEFVQPFLADATFDWQDVLATLIGGGISVLIFRVVVERRRSR